MDETDADARIFLRQVTGHMLGTVDRAVLAACAAETDHQTGESALDICIHMRIDNSICMLHEAENFPVILEELYHRLVTPRQVLIWFISTGIMDRPAVENISPAVS